MSKNILKIICVIMCGGKSSRMKIHPQTEKSMIKLGDRRIVEYIIDSIINTNYFFKIIINTSKNTPRTKSFLLKKYKKYFSDIEFCETPGNGYSLDLKSVIKKYNDYVIFVVSADLPLLSVHDIKKILSLCRFEYPCNSIIVEKYFVENLGIKPSISFTHKYLDYCYSGIGVFNPKRILDLENIIPERFIIQNRIGIAINVNEKSDLVIAKRMMRAGKIGTGVI
jgi:GTP:adenosylcobinamide-phosphate guanylyltransferase